MQNLHHDDLPLALQHHLHQRLWPYNDPKDIGQDDYVSPLDAEYRRQGRQQASVGTIPTAEVLSTTGLADRDRSETSIGNGDESVPTVWVIVEPTPCLQKRNRGEMGGFHHGYRRDGVSGARASDHTLTPLL